MGLQKSKRPLLAPGFQGDLSACTGLPLSKQSVFTASQQTGTGSSQNIAHGLGSTPAFVLVIPTDGGTVTYGTHTSTNVVVTVTSTKKFDVFASL